MANSKKMIVGLMILVGSLTFIDCGFSAVNEGKAKKYAYSKLENEVFNESYKFSRSIPKGFVEDVSLSRTSEEYFYHDPESSIVNGGKLRYIRYFRSNTSTSGLGVVSINVNDDVVKGLREDKAELSTLLTLTDFVGFSVFRPGERADEIESYTMLRKGNGLYEVVCYEGRKGDPSWIRYEGVYNKYDDFNQIKQSAGKKVPIGQVQRYIALAERFKETYFSIKTALTNLPGSGTLLDPWRIKSLSDFNEFAADPCYWDGYTRLETDVNLAEQTYSTAVIAPDTDNSSVRFQGTGFSGFFDGNGHKIRGLTIDDGGAGNSCLGLFGRNDGEVWDLGLEGVSVSGTGYDIGGLVGENNGRVTNCYCTGRVSGADGTGAHLGDNDSVGGLIGDNSGNLTNCYFTGRVSGDAWVGGLVGLHWRGKLSNCYSTGDVRGSCQVGGLVGRHDNGTVSKCYSTGDVSISRMYGMYVGGLVGRFGGSMSNCCSTGDVSGTGKYVGGLVGESTGRVSKSYCTGSVSGDNHVGGLVGRNSFSSVSNCYSTGDVNGTGNYVGGLVGDNDKRGSVSNCFWDADTQTHGVTESIGKNEGTVTNVAGLPTAQMLRKDTFTSAGWDFEQLWTIKENETYPYFHPYFR